MENIEFILRAMEWERTKGSLQAILSSYTDKHIEDMEHFKKLESIVKIFVKEFGEKAGID